MPHPITQAQKFGYLLLNKQLGLAKTEKGEYLKYWKGYKGDFWQAGKGYLGPPPKKLDANGRKLAAAIQARFVSRNVLAEMVNRVSSAYLGKDPDWKYVVDGKQINRRAQKRTNTTDEAKTATEGDGKQAQSELDEMDMLLGEFWTNSGLASELIKAFESRLVRGRGSIRIYIPARFLTENQNVTPGEEADENDISPPTINVASAKTLAEAFKMIKVEFLDAEQSKVIEDGGWELGIVKYDVQEDWDTDKKRSVIEFSFVDEDKLTFVGTFKDGDLEGMDKAEKSSGLNLDEKITIHEFFGTPYVTEQIWQCNSLLNLSLTMAGFGLVESGFAELILTNVDLATEKKINPATGEMEDVPVGIQRGGGAVQNFVGMESVDYESGSKELATPGVHFKDPTPMDTYKDGKDLAYAACLEEGGQKYALISGDATTTGESRIQAVGDFWLRVKPYRSEINQGGSNILTAIMRLAAALCGKTESFINTSILFDSKIRITTLTTDERRLVVEMQERHIISRETARVLLEIEDPLLEEDLVSKEFDVDIERDKKRLDAGLDATNKNIPTKPENEPGNKPKKTQ